MVACCPWLFGASEAVLLAPTHAPLVSARVALAPSRTHLLYLAPMLALPQCSFSLTNNVQIVYKKTSLLQTMVHL